MDLREKPSFWFRLAETILRLRWIWILSFLLIAYVVISKVSPLWANFSEEIRMQNKFTLQFLVLNKGSVSGLLGQVFKMGLPFIVPIGAGALIAFFFKQRWGYLVFPVIFLTLWQYLFLSAELQSKYLLMLVGMGVLGFIGLLGKQNLGGLILPIFLVGSLGFLFNLLWANSLMLLLVKEYHWNIELLTALLFTDLSLLGARSVGHMHQGKPKIAALAHGVKELMPIWLLRNLGILFLSGLWIAQSHPDFLAVTLVSQILCLGLSLLLATFLFPALLSILPFKSFNKS